MLLVTGEVERITEREAGAPGNTWLEQTLVVRDWGQTLYVTVGREMAEKGLPSEGDKVALECSVRAYVNREGKPGHGYTAHRRSAEVEGQIYGKPPVRAAG